MPATAVISYQLYVDTYLGLPVFFKTALGFALGALAGSFCATILLRWPAGESVARGRSHCDRCARQLVWYELVPLISHILFRGKCRTCKCAIDNVHWQVELAFAAITAILFALAVPMWAPLAWLLILLGFFDAFYLWLPNRMTLVLAGLAIALPPLDESIGLVARLATGLTCFAGMALLAAIFRLMKGKDGLGGGDPKLFGALGIWAGPVQIPAVLLLACTIGLADAAMRMAAGRPVRSIQFPLGTYLCAAGLVFMFFAAWLSAIYE